MKVELPSVLIYDRSFKWLFMQNQTNNFDQKCSFNFGSSFYRDMTGFFVIKRILVTDKQFNIS